MVVGGEDDGIVVAAAGGVGGRCIAGQRKRIGSVDSQMVDIHKDVRSDGMVAAEDLAEVQVEEDVPAFAWTVSANEAWCSEHLEYFQGFEDPGSAHNGIAPGLRDLVPAGVPMIVSSYCFAEGRIARRHALLQLHL